MEVFNPLKGLIEPASSQESGESRLVPGASFLAQVLESEANGHTTFKVGSRLLSAYLSQYIEPGNEVRLVVAETSPRLVLRLLAPAQAEEIPGPKSPAPQEPAPLRRQLPDDAILARVLKPPSGGRVQLKIISVPAASLQTAAGKTLTPGREITARLAGTGPGLDLKPGTDVKFQVAETSPQLVLKVSESPVADKTPPLSSLTSWLGDPARFIKAVSGLQNALTQRPSLPEPVEIRAAGLQTLLAGLSPPPEETPDPDFPKRLLGLLGLIGQRGGLKEEITRFFSEIIRQPALEHLKDNPDLRSILDSAARLFETLDHVQTLSHENARGDQLLFMSLPLFWAGESGRGEMTMQWNSKDDRTSDDRPYRLTMLLALSRIGRIKIDVTLERRVLTGAVWTETEPALETVRQRLPHLAASLEARGITASDLRVHLFPRQSRPLESLVEDLLPAQESLIDVRV